MDPVYSLVLVLRESSMQNSCPYLAPAASGMLEATQDSGFENLLSDLSQLPSWAVTYDPRLAEEGHSHPVSSLGALGISQGIQPLGQWSLPAHFATTCSTHLPSSHETTDSMVDTYDMRGYAMSPAAARSSSPSYPSIARSYSGVYIRSLGVYVPYLQLLSTGIAPFSMSEGDNTVSLMMRGCVMSVLPKWN